MATRPPANLRERLRLVTRDAHLRLEAEVDFDGRLTSLEVYRFFLEDFFRFVRPVEAVLDGLDLKKLGIDYSSRRKTSWIETDLKDLGHTSESLEHLQSFDELPELTEPVEALGAMYVLEGSSLGRQVMLSKLGTRLNIRPDWAGHFFSGYGKQTGAMWQSFVAVLNEVGKAPEHARLIEASALATFAAFEKCLAESRMRGGEQPAS
jgi:heme oxygenase